MLKNPFEGSQRYSTKREKPVSPLLRALPSLAFYSRIVWIVRESNRLVREGRYDGATWIEYSLRTMRAIEEVGADVNVSGLENLEGLTGPVVYAANHMSTLETFMLPCILRPRGLLTFVVKKSLLEYPYFGAVLNTCRPIAVGRANPREDLVTVMGEGAARLAEGYSVVVFPQTTRSSAFDQSKFNSIGAKLAARAKVPLVPVALRTDAWGQGRLIKDVGFINPKLPVDFVFGEPIGPEGKGDSAHKKTVEFIAGVFAKWDSERRTP